MQFDRSKQKAEADSPPSARLARPVRTRCRLRVRHERAGNMFRFGAQDSLSIAMIAPPWFTVPPKGFGGVENVCGDLAVELVPRGPSVTIVAAGRGRTSAQFVATYAEPPSAR